MKKFFSLILAIVLISFITFAQEDSLPIDVSFTFEYESGIALSITDTDIAWALIPLHIDPLTDESYLPSDEGPVDIVISFKLPTGHKAQLNCYTTALISENGTPTKNWSNYIHHEIAGEFVVAEIPMPNPTDGNQILWTSTLNGGKRVGQITWKVWQHEEFGKTGVIYTGTATYIVLDVIA